MAVRLPRLAFVSMLLAAALLAGCAAPEAPSGPQDSAPVSVEFVNPAEFTEMRNHPQQSDSYNKGWMDALRKHLERQAAHYLPPDTHLQVRFTDVRLAGDYEPWRRPMQSDVRIVRDIYPPRIDLSYRLTGADGRILRQGSDELREPAFMMQTRRYHDDPQNYEKSMLDDWLRKEFGRN